jgi:hypothetical protein
LRKGHFHIYLHLVLWINNPHGIQHCIFYKLNVQLNNQAFTTCDGPNMQHNTIQYIIFIKKQIHWNCHINQSASTTYNIYKSKINLKTTYRSPRIWICTWLTTFSNHLQVPITSHNYKLKCQSDQLLFLITSHIYKSQ